MRIHPLSLFGLVCVLSVGSLRLDAQDSDWNRYRDSLRQVIGHGKKDTGTVSAYHELALSYFGLHPDSMYYYAYPGALLARDIGFRRGEATILSIMGTGLSQMGDYARALDTMLRSLKIYEELDDNDHIGTALWAISQTYQEQKEYSESIRYMIKAEELQEKIKNSTGIDRVRTFIGRAYGLMGMQDSALYYLQLANVSGTTRNDFGIVFMSRIYLAMVYTQLHKDDTALTYFRLTLPLLASSPLIDILCEANLCVAQIFEMRRQADSAVYYGRQSLDLARSSKLTSRQLQASHFLASFFKSHHLADSAVRYLEVSVALKDSLYDQQKLTAVQALTFTEKIRQEELEEQRRRAEANATKNLQLLAIGIFIPVFFLFVLFLSRVKVKARTVEFLGLIGLLMLFEFVTDLIFPWISGWTNDSPIWEMVALVLIAILLEPLNFRLEKWVKSLLVGRG